MSQSHSDKKNFQKILSHCLSGDNTLSFADKFRINFKVHRRDNTDTAINYLKGLFFCSKGEANMERMEEEVSKSEYRAYQHFISHSKWNWKGLQDQVASETSLLFTKEKANNKKPVGYIIDESSHLKKGTKSVGVARQYAGVIGKVDNSQVGVYVSLVNKTFASIINERIFLPKGWIEDSQRCKDAGIPQESCIYKTKPQLALEMIKQDIERGVCFDWIGGDGLYGHNNELCEGIDFLGCFYVLDVHKDETVFLEEPSFSVPKVQSKRGRKPTRLKPNIEAVRLDHLEKMIPKDQWKLEKIRDTVKGKLMLQVYKKEVWTWDRQSNKAKKRLLIITKTKDKKPKIKFSMSNGNAEDHSHKEYAYFVSQRYWVERSFDNAKNELGMSDYQIRKWQSWHTHHSLVMMASLYVTTQLIESQQDIPLLSFRDARILIVVNICATQIEIKEKARQMVKRHKKRKVDIDRHYRLQNKNLKS